MSSKVWVKEYLNMMYLHLSPGTSHCSKREQRLLKSQFVEIFSLHNYPNRHSEMDNRNEIRRNIWHRIILKSAQQHSRKTTEDYNGKHYA